MFTIIDNLTVVSAVKIKYAMRYLNANFQCTLKHIPIQMNQSSILTNMSTQVVICHPVYEEEKCAFNITISIKQDIPHYNKLISISIDPVTELLACIA